MAPNLGLKSSAKAIDLRPLVQHWCIGRKKGTLSFPPQSLRGNTNCKKRYEIVQKVSFGQNFALLKADFQSIKVVRWQLTTLTFTFQKQTRPKLYLLTHLDHPIDHI